VEYQKDYILKAQNINKISIFKVFIVILPTFQTESERNRASRHNIHKMKIKQHKFLKVERKVLHVIIYLNYNNREYNFIQHKKYAKI
jgi:hypothetical protein